ncbi:hypothetical protein D3C84_974790 [compost metagenome]
MAGGRVDALPTPNSGLTTGLSHKRGAQLDVSLSHLKRILRLDRLRWFRACQVDGDSLNLRANQPENALAEQVGKLGERVRVGSEVLNRSGFASHSPGLLTSTLRSSKKLSVTPPPVTETERDRPPV